MPGFIENPRRAPRAPMRCDARVAAIDGGYFTAPTTDYGPGGCQLETPAPLAPGARVLLELASERVPGTSPLSGRVAWCSPEAPWRCGIAFDAGAAPAADGFFARLAEAYPDIDAAARAPDRIAEDAALAPAPPPPHPVALLAEEANVLRTLGAGASASSLRAALGARWDAAVNPLFALLGRGWVVVGPPDPAAAAAWAPRLAPPAAQGLATVAAADAPGAGSRSSR